MCRVIRAVIAAAALVLAGLSAHAGTTLVMVQEKGCMWCARWDREIAPIYPRTEEGARAPLRRIGMNEPVPAGLTFRAPLTFTPTFVLMSDGAEIGRIEGYPGEDFFWGLLGQLIQSLPPEPDAPPDVAG